MKYMDRVIFGVLFLMGLGVSHGVQACSLAAWSSNSGAIAVGSPVGTSPTVPRVSEACGLEVTGEGYVEDENPDDDRVISRFYVYLNDLDGTATTTLFVAYDAEDGTQPLYSVSFDANNSEFDFAGDLSVRGPGTEFSLAANAGWNMIEIDWETGSDFSASVIYFDPGTQTFPELTGSASAGSGKVDSVRLGAPEGFNGNTGFIYYDSYQANRTQEIGPLLIGDADNDGAVNILDYTAVQQDAGGTLQPGQPDCNLDGAVNILDYGCVQAVAGS